MHDIRLATTSDIDVIARHRVRMFEDMGTLPPEHVPRMVERTRRFLERAIPAGEYVGWLASPREHPDAISAGAGLQRRTVLPFPPGGAGREALVINVYTEPAFRRLGLARAVMEALIAWSREAGIERLALHASPYGRSLYADLGFVETNEMRLVLDETMRR
jgi:GNAT superfamily N-acetyltransferase